MIIQVLHCPHCDGTDIVRHGQTRQGKQRYRCVSTAVALAEGLAWRRGLTSELDAMWSYVGKKAHPRWLWHAIDHRSGQVLAYVLGRRQDAVFLQLTALLAPCGITRFYTDGWGGLRTTSRRGAPCRRQGAYAED